MPTENNDIPIDFAGMKTKTLVAYALACPHCNDLVYRLDELNLAQSYTIFKTRQDAMKALDFFKKSGMTVDGQMPILKVIQFTYLVDHNAEQKHV